MKKIFIFLAIIVVILCVILYQYNSYQRAQNAINSENSEYEQYLDKEIYGIDIASLINAPRHKIATTTNITRSTTTGVNKLSEII